MKPSEKIEKIFTQINIKTNPDVDKVVLGDAVNAMPKSKQKTPVYDKPDIWRIIMKTKITKFATAAVIIIAVLIGMNQFGDSGVVLADVIKKTCQFDTFIQREKRIMRIPGQDAPAMVTDSIKYVSTEHGIVEKQYSKDGKLITTVYYITENQQCVTVLHPTKQYFTIQMDHTALGLDGSFSALGYAQWMISGSHSDLGIKEIEGKKVQGFGVKNPPAVEELAKASNGIFNIGESQWELWVDVNTNLPIKVTGEYIINKSFLSRNQEVCVTAETYDIQWGAEVDESLFEFNIPAGYTELDISKLQ